MGDVDERDQEIRSEDLLERSRELLKQSRATLAQTVVDDHALGQALTRSASTLDRTMDRTDSENDA